MRVLDVILEVSQLLPSGTRRTLDGLARAVLGAPLAESGTPRARNRDLNRRPLDPQDLHDIANETFALLLIERKLRQLQLPPKTILGGSGVHALFFGNPYILTCEFQRPSVRHLTLDPKSQFYIF